MLAVRHAEYEFNYGGEGNHMTNLGYDCNDCNMAACTGCHEHENVAVPDGWLTYQQSRDLMAKSFGSK